MSRLEYLFYDQGKGFSLHNRRDFLKLLGGAFGAVWLSGCGGSDFSSPITGNSLILPTTYRLTPVFQSGTPLPGGSSVLVAAQGASNQDLPFPGGLLLNDQSQLFFHAVDNVGRLGIYRVDLNSANPSATIAKVIRNGDVLPDGNTAVHHSCGDLNNNNDFLIAIKTANGLNSLYLSRELGPLNRVLSAFDSLDSGITLHGHIKGSATLHDDSDFLFTSNFYDPTRSRGNSQGLFFVPKADTSKAELLLASGDLLPGLEATVNTIGHSQLHSQGRFVVHGAASPLSGQSSNPHLSYVLRGKVNEEHQLLGFHPDLPHSQMMPTSVAMGTAVMSPRLGHSSHSTLVHLSTNESELRVDGRVVYLAQAPGGASLSPRGNPIVSMLPPVFGPSGLFLVQLFTTQGMELVVSNGTQSATVMARGDKLDGQTINTILCGALARGANRRAEFATVVEFTNKQHAIVLGTPV